MRIDPARFKARTLFSLLTTMLGLRVFDIRNQFRPEEVGFFIPPAPEGQKAPMFNDLYVDTDGLIYVTDRIKGGLYILEYTGPEDSVKNLLKRQERGSTWLMVGPYQLIKECNPTGIHCLI